MLYVLCGVVDLWSKWDTDGKGALSARDIWEMTQSTREANDFFGW
jgi:hypothetical protein